VSGVDMTTLLGACHRRVLSAMERLVPLGLDGELADLRDAATGRELRVAVLGRFKSGKSSVVNALVGAEVSPVDVLPCTARAIEIRKKIDWLGDGVVLVDTPGSDEDAARTAIADEETARADAALLVLRATQPAALVELEQIEALRRRGAAVLVCVNRSDELDERASVEVLRFVRERVATVGVAADHVTLFSALFGEGVDALRASMAQLVRNEVLGLRLSALYRRVELATSDLAPKLAAIGGEKARAASDALTALHGVFRGGT
jgi:predicted GTPase